jgi:hypothetical protein
VAALLRRLIQVKWSVHDCMTYQTQRSSDGSFLQYSMADLRLRLPAVFITLDWQNTFIFVNYKAIALHVLNRRGFRDSLICLKCSRTPVWSAIT